MQKIAFLVLLIFQGLCAQDENYKVSSIPSPLLENTNAVVRNDHMVVDINSAKDMTVTIKHSVTVLNRLGNRFIQDRIGFNENIKIKKAEITVYDASGNAIKKYKKKDFRERSTSDGFSLYNSYRILYVDYTPVNYPYTFEIQYQYTTPNSILIPNWHFLGGYNLSSEKSNVTINYPSTNFDIHIEERNLDAYTIQKSITPGKIQYTSGNINAIKKESYSPSSEEIFPMLQIATKEFYYDGYTGVASNWKEFGKWYYDNLLKGRDVLSDATISKIQHLTSGIEEPLEKAKIVYDYVQKNTRYVSVQIGIGGHRPITASEVDKVKYGDCKGLTNYTKALLEVVGVPSYYAVVEAGDEQINIPEQVPSIKPGNHVILAIPNKEEYTWLECTSQKIPFGYLGDFTDNRRVLLMKPTGGEFVFTEKYLDKQNHSATRANYSMDANGNIKATVSITSKGLMYNNRYGLENNPTRDNTIFYKNHWKHINNLNIEKFHFKNDRDSIVFQENIELNASSYGVVTGDRILFPLNAFSSKINIPNTYSKRVHPINFKRGYFYEDAFTLEVPDEFQIEAMPENYSLKTEFGEYSVKISKTDTNTITYLRKFYIKEGNYPKESFSDFRTFIRDAALYDNAKLVLIKK